MVEMLEDATHDERVEEAQEALERIRNLSQSLAQELPFMAALAAETEDLANVLWAPDGFAYREERSIKALETTRHHQAQLNRIAELTGRKFEAYGHRGSVTRWWPDIPEDFPEPGTIAEIIRGLEEAIPEVEHRLITYEQQRSNAHEMARTTILQLQSEMGENLDSELTQKVRDLLAVRQDLLDELIQRLGRYSNHLVEYQTASTKFLRQVRDVEKFLYSHILWSRSVPRPIIPRPRDMTEAAIALTPIQYLNSVSFVGFEMRGKGLFAALLLALAVVLRQPIRRRMEIIAEQVSDPERDNLTLTIRALINTIVLAAPLPIAFWLAGILFDLIGSSTYWHAAAEAFFEMAMVAALFELVRQVFAPNGLAEAHFTWPTYATRPLYRGSVVDGGDRSAAPLHCTPPRLRRHASGQPRPAPALQQLAGQGCVHRGNARLRAFDPGHVAARKKDRPDRPGHAGALAAAFFRVRLSHSVSRRLPDHHLRHLRARDPRRLSVSTSPGCCSPTR